MSLPHDLVDRVMALESADRAELVHRLIRSLPPDREPGYEKAWADEIERRFQDFEADPSIAVPLDEAMDSIRQNLGLGR